MPTNSVKGYSGLACRPSASCRGSGKPIFALESGSQREAGTAFVTSGRDRSVMYAPPGDDRKRLGTGRPDESTSGAFRPIAFEAWPAWRQSDGSRVCVVGGPTANPLSGGNCHGSQSVPDSSARGSW